MIDATKFTNLVALIMNEKYGLSHRVIDRHESLIGIERRYIANPDNAAECAFRVAMTLLEMSDIQTPRKGV
jgi:hypothetical protein